METTDRLSRSLIRLPFIVHSYAMIVSGRSCHCLGLRAARSRSKKYLPTVTIPQHYGQHMIYIAAALAHRTRLRVT